MDNDPKKTTNMVTKWIQVNVWSGHHKDLVLWAEQACETRWFTNMAELNNFKLIQSYVVFLYIYNTEFSKTYFNTLIVQEKKYIILRMWNTLLVILNADVLSLPLTVKKNLKSIKENLSVLWRKQKSVTPLDCNRQGNGWSNTPSVLIHICQVSKIIFFTFPVYNKVLSDFLYYILLQNIFFHVAI